MTWSTRLRCFLNRWGFDMPKKAITSDSVLDLYHALPDVYIWRVHVGFCEAITYMYSAADGTKLTDHGGFERDSYYVFGMAHSQQELELLAANLRSMSEAQFRKLGLAMSWIHAINSVMAEKWFTSPSQYKSVKRKIVDRTISVAKERV